MPCDVMMCVATTLRYYASQIVLYRYSISRQQPYRRIGMIDTAQNEAGFEETKYCCSPFKENKIITGGVDVALSAGSEE